jgi:hypothetical protein
MFTNQNALLLHNQPQLNYGVAVIDIDNDGEFELFVAGYGYPNQVLKWNGSVFINIADEVLADADRQAIGVAGGDFDGDGREEIYVLNTDSFAGRKRFGDRLFGFFNGEWLDLFDMPRNLEAVNQTAGRSVACLDRTGLGRYGFMVANYGGPMRLYELDDDGILIDAAPHVGLDLTTGGRSLLSGPLVSESMDVFAANEGGPNFLFCNLGNGAFGEVAEEFGLSDPHEHGRGVAALSVDDSERFAIVCGNWEGPQRLFQWTEQGYYQDKASAELALPTRVRTVIVADFDNDGYQEIFFHNMGEPNRLFGWRNESWQLLDIGEALEGRGLGTGGAVGDFDGDGRLELLLAHGEAGLQPLTLYHTPANGNAWLRVLPLTKAGAPARGALVLLHANGRIQRRLIDAGSGYLCQMEPVAHFGLGAGEVQVEQVEIRWPDGTSLVIESPKVCQTLRVPFPVAKVKK